MTLIPTGRAILLAAATVVLSTPAVSQTTPFFGNLLNDTPPSLPGPPCSTGQVNVSLSPSTGITQGLSNLGNFVFTQQHCVTLPPTGYSGGTFSFDFTTGDRFFGSYAGTLTPTATPGLLTNAITYTVAGGTGRFLEASGTIDGIGTLDLRVNRPINAFALSGIVTVSPIPEPQAALMLAAGLGAVGFVARRRR